MKYLLLILLSFALQAKVFTVMSSWNCNRLDISSRTASLPQSANLKIRVDTSTNSVSINPDIFNDIDFSNKDSIVNSDSCLVKLLSVLDGAVEEYVKNCDSCNLVSKDIKSNLKKEIASSSYFKKSQTLPKLPRVYSGHNEYIVKTDKKLIDKFCADKDLSAKEILAINGLSFIQQMSAELSYDKSAFDKKCINKIEKFQKKFTPKSLDCEDVTCIEIKSKIATRDATLSTLYNDYDFAQNKEDIEKLENLGFLVADSKIEAQILQNAVSDEDKDKCSIEHTMKFNDRGYSSIYKYDSVISKLIDTKYQGLPLNCIRSIVTRYIRDKEISADSNVICESDYCNERKSLYHQNIVRLMSFSHTKEQIDLFCKSPPNGKLFESYIDMWNKLDDISMCTELKIGESRPLLDKSTNGVGHYHGLKRLSDKKYEATLAIDFKSDDEAANEEMRERMNSCISKTSDYFKSPNGEQMDLKIISSEDNKKLQKDQQLKLVEIGIADKGEYFRSNSKKYAADIPCSTITHELLHLMGLVDEYHETAIQAYYNPDTKEAFNPRYFPAGKSKDGFEQKVAYVDCRSHSIENSVMALQRDRFADAVKSKVSCKCETKECIDVMKNPKLAKIANFSTPDDFNIKDYCTVKTLKKSNLSKDFESDDVYTDVSYSENSLVFTSPEVNFGSRFTEDKEAKVIMNQTSCKCTTDKCREDIANFKSNIIDVNKYNSRRYCPYGTELQKDESEDIADINESDYSINDDGVFTFTTTPSKDSLLMPAHFEKMKWGSCSTKATRYNKCASYAYMLVDFQCTDKPKYCESDEGWLQSTK